MQAEGVNATNSNPSRGSQSTPAQRLPDAVGEPSQGPVRPSFRDTLGLLFKARFPVLYIESFEEARVAREVAAVASNAERVRTPRPVHSWSVTQGIVGPDGKAQANTTDPSKALD